MTIKPKRMLAFDLGASNGRALLGTYDGDRLELKTIHSFPVEAVTIGNRIYWDILGLYVEIKKALVICKNSGIVPDSIGIDTWGATNSCDISMKTY